MAEDRVLPNTLQSTLPARVGVDADHGARAPHNDDPQDAPAPSTNALATILGLSGSETKALGRMFVTAAGALGMDGAFIFERLSRGESLARALALPAGTAELLYARAHRWFAAGRPERAEPLFQALCLIDGTDADCWVGYGVCLKLRGANAEALMAFEVAGRLRPGWAMPDFHALEIALRKGDEEAAQSYLARFKAHAGGGDIPEAVHAEVARWSVALDLRVARRGEQEARDGTVEGRAGDHLA